MKNYDAIIVGSGPAGSATALWLAKLGRTVLLVDKDKFPRDKTCGDAQSGKTRHQLRLLGVWDDVLKKTPHLAIREVLITSPDGTQLHVNALDKHGQPGGITSKRKDFDHTLHRLARAKTETLDRFTVTGLTRNAGTVTGVTGHGPDGQTRTLHARVVVGADGPHSVVAKELGLPANPPDHECFALRAYYHGVTGLTPAIELHFLPEFTPGYLWIFPLPNGDANVGVGLLTRDLRAQKTNLKDALHRAVTQNPRLATRFTKATLASDIRGWPLPFASHKRPLAHRGAVLVGDAAGLVDPFTGEGVGNALLSANLAAHAIHHALQKNDVSQPALQAYPDRLWKEIGGEISHSHLAQQLSRHPWLLNRIVGKAAHDPHVREVLAGALINEQARQQFNDPLFALKLLLG